MNRFITSVVAIMTCSLFSACSSKKNIDKMQWIKAYKNTAFIACMNENISMENDISLSINFDLIGNTIFYKQADSVGKSYNLLIKPALQEDYENKKIIGNSCLEFYMSNALDSIAEETYKTHITKHL